MSSRSVVLVPADRATNIELVTQVATALAAPGAADIHILNVTPRAQSWHALEDWRGRPWVLADNRSARTETATLSAKKEGTIRDVRLRGKDERIIPGYAQLTGARAIVVDRHYGTTPLWRSTAVVARMSRLSPVPILALPSEGPALERWARGNISAVVTAVDSDARVRGRAANGRRSRGSTRRAPDDASCARKLSRAFRVQRQRGMAPRPGTAAPTTGRSRNGLNLRRDDSAKRTAVAHVVTGDAAAGIVSAASETNADVIVMGVAPRAWLDSIAVRFDACRRAAPR